MSRKKKSIKKWSQKQLDILYECWKEGDTNKERLPLIESRLPNMPAPVALSLMRKYARSDSKWIRWVTRKKNEKEREKLEKRKARERKREEINKRKEAREKRRVIREEEKKELSRRQKMKSSLDDFYLDDVKNKVSSKFFFCPDVHQYVNNISCIFRVFGMDREEFSIGPPCDKCKRLDSNIPVLEEIIKNGRQKKKSRRNTSSPQSIGKRKKSGKTS